MDEPQNTTQPPTVAIPAAVLAFINAVTTPSPDKLSVSAAMARRREETLRNIKPGQQIDGQGVFIGTYTYIGIREGHSLKQTFNVFAAPYDLTDEDGHDALFTYHDALKRISALKDWHGFDGTSFLDDRDLFKALETGAYDGGWILPPMALLSGSDPAGIREHPDNLRARANSGALRGTFKPPAFNGDNHPGWYWSSSQAPDNVDLVCAAETSSNLKSCLTKDSPRLSCRLVRLVPVSHGGLHG